MISKFIKIYCYALMGLSTLASLALLIAGLVSLADEGNLAWFFIILGIVLPLASIISLYPLFALSRIDENLCSLTEKVNSLTQVPVTAKNKEASHKPFIQDKKPIQSQPLFEHIPPSLSSSFQDTISFINKKYSINLCEDDNIDLIKEKIASIENPSFSVVILQSKIASAATKEEAINLLNMHRVAHS